MRKVVKMYKDQILMTTLRCGCKTVPLVLEAGKTVVTCDLCEKNTGFTVKIDKDDSATVEKTFAD